MDDRFKEGFDRIVAETTEGPSWEDLATTRVTAHTESPRRRNGLIVALGAFAIAVVVVGVVAMFTSRGPVGPAAADTTTTTASSVLTEDESLGIQIWVNGLGLVQTDETIWRARYDEACSEGVWDAEVALRLGAHFVDKDIAMGVSERDPSIGDPTPEEAANALWLTALQSCRDLYPAEVLDAGPPFNTDDNGQALPSLSTSCGPVSLGEGMTPSFPTTPLSPDAEAALAGTRNLGEEGDFFFGTIDWTIADDTDGLVLFGRAIESDADPAYGYAQFERRNDVWAATGWGQCRLEVEADGWNGSDWVVNPEQEVDPAGSSIDILVSERECANGEAPGDRAIVPVVIAEESLIIVTVLIEPMPDDGPDTTVTCPGNPWVEVTVELGELLGDRDLYDGREVPPVLVWSSDGTMLGRDDR